MKSWNEIRNDFPLLRGNTVYLDSASTSQKPDCVLAAIAELYEEYYANIHRGLYFYSEKTTARYLESKEIVANFLNAASYRSIIYTKNATESLNMACLMLEPFLKKNDEIILSVMEHHSNLLPWQQLAKRKELIIRYIPVDEEKNLQLDVLHEAVNEKTKIVALNHVSNVLGTINPIGEIIAFFQGRNIYTIIDGSQAVGHIPVDVLALQADFYAFSGHKTFAPTGIGVLVVKESLLNTLEPLFYGGEMVASVTLDGFTYNELPWKFEAGTSNIEGGIALGTAVSYIESIGITNIQTYCDLLTRYFISKLEEIPQVTVVSNVGKMAASVVSFSIKKIHPHDIAQLMDKDNICIRAGMHCAQPLVNALGYSALARVSIHCYNTREDLDQCITSIKSILKLFSNG